MKPCGTPLVTPYQAPSLVRGVLDPCHPVSSCVLVGSSWFAWYFLLDTFKLHVLKSYAPLSYLWVQHPTTLPTILQWVDWSNFPLSDSVLFHPTPLVLLIHGPFLAVGVLLPGLV